VHLLDLPVGLFEPEPFGERLRALVDDVGSDPRDAEGGGVIDEAVEQQAADPTPTRLGQHAGRDEPAAGRVRHPGQPAARELPVQLGEHAQLLRLRARADLLDRPGRLVREDDAPHVEPGLDVLVGLDRPEVDHPDRFSFPCRFAYCSPRRKTQSPSGIDTAPITISGQMSPHTAAGPAPSMIAALIPRSA